MSLALDAMSVCVLLAVRAKAEVQNATALPEPVEVGLESRSCARSSSLRTQDQWMALATTGGSQCAPEGKGNY
jgi:hypothetical protein